MAIGEYRYRTNGHTKAGCLYHMIDELCELRSNTIFAIAVKLRWKVSIFLMTIFFFFFVLFFFFFNRNQLVLEFKKSNDHEAVID